MDDHYARWEKEVYGGSDGMHASCKLPIQLLEEMEPIMNDLRELRNAHHDLLRKRRNDAEKAAASLPNRPCAANT
eukprot:2736096-Amphidinium_carterae.1